MASKFGALGALCSKPLISEAFHGKCDSFERDIITGRFRSFSTVVIIGVLFGGHKR